MTRLAEPIIIAQWWKNRGGEAVRVMLSTYADRNLVDLRTWYSEDGKLQPGKGFAAEVKHLPRLAAAFAKAEAKATELGLLPANATMTTGAVGWALQHGIASGPLGVALNRLTQEHDDKQQVQKEPYR